MDVLNPKILIVDGRHYRLNNSDCCPNDCIEAPTPTDHVENLPSYIEKDGETMRILFN